MYTYATQIIKLVVMRMYGGPLETIELLYLQKLYNKYRMRKDALYMDVNIYHVQDKLFAWKTLNHALNISRQANPFPKHHN